MTALNRCVHFYHKLFLSFLTNFKYPKKDTVWVLASHFLKSIGLGLVMCEFLSIGLLRNLLIIKDFASDLF
jgi:hypothetical protein